jgi:hypothetical protein
MESSDRDAISYSLTVEQQTTSISAGPPKAVVTRYGLFLRGEVDHAARTQSRPISRQRCYKLLWTYWVNK